MRPASPQKFGSIEAFRAALDPETRTTIDLLREIILAAHGSLIEEIKWNAPSYRHGNDDRVNLGLDRKGTVRMVLHRGAKPRETSAFRFEDPDRLATWPSPDRGVVTLADAAEVETRRDDLTALVARWIVATDES